MKPRQRKINLPIFRAEFHLACADTIAAATQVLPRAYHNHNKVHSNDAGLMIQDGDGGFAVLLVAEHCDLNTLAHELTHVVVDLLHRNGIKIDTDNDETAAHLMGWLMETCAATLRKWGVKL